jgi:hypothetical protein
MRANDMNLKKFLLLTGGLTLVAASQHVVAIPSGKFLFGADTETKQPATKAPPKEKAPIVAIPSGKFLFGADTKTKQPATKAPPKEKDSKNKKASEDKKQIERTPSKTDTQSKAERVTLHIAELQDTMRCVADEINALEISKKTLGSDVTPITDRKISFWNSKHFYVGVGASYAWIAVKDKVSADKRTIKWNEQKVDYYAMVSSILYIAKRDAQDNVVYGTDGIIQYDKQPEPKDDAVVKSFYESFTDDNGTYMKLKELDEVDKQQLKDRLKVLVDAFLEKLNILEPDADGLNTIRYTTIEIGDNTYSSIKDDGTDSRRHQFYFGDANKGLSDNDPLKFVNGLNQLDNLCWSNLIFTNYDSTVSGHHVTLLQAMGEYSEQTFGGQQTMTIANIPGVYTTMTSARYTEDSHDGSKNDKFTKTAEMDAINDQIKTYKPSFGGSIFAGYGGTSGRIYYGIELGAGYSHLKTNIIKHSNITPTNQTDFANGNVEYVDKNEEIHNPVKTANILGKVYDPETGKVRPVYVSGMGRQAGATLLSLPDFRTAYDISVKKNVNFSITPIIGLTHVNTVYYVSFGFTYNRYGVKIQPNTEVLKQYANAVPVPYLNGHLENFKGSSFLHEYVKRLNEAGQLIEAQAALSAESAKLPGLEAIHPSAVIETNDAGEKNTFSGIRMIYPHYDDGGISVVGEASERPWLNSDLASKALSVKKVKKFRFGFKPGIGVKTFINRNYFVDLRYSFQFGDKITVKHDEFVAYPAHTGRANMRHKLKMTGHEIKLSFGRLF